MKRRGKQQGNTHVGWNNTKTHRMTACSLTVKAGPAVGMDKVRQMSCVVPTRRKTKVDGVQLNGGTDPLCTAVLKEPGPNKSGSGLALYLHCFLRFPKGAVQYQLHRRREMMGSEGWKCSCCLCGAKPVCQCWQREKRLVRSGTSCEICRSVDFFFSLFLLIFSFPTLPFFSNPEVWNCFIFAETDKVDLAGVPFPNPPKSPNTMGREFLFIYCLLFYNIPAISVLSLQTVQWVMLYLLVPSSQGWSLEEQGVILHWHCKQRQGTRERAKM